MKLNKTPLALAVAALCVSPLAFATDLNLGLDVDAELDADADLTLSILDNRVKNQVSVDLDKDTSFDTDVDVTGTANVVGTIVVDSSASAVIDDKQINHDNGVGNIRHENNASLDGNAMSDASGNMGVNISAGDNNMQDNAAALAAADASFVFSASDAEVYAFQRVDENTTVNSGNLNNARLGGNALTNASGNIAVNVAAGNSNLQKNNLSVAVANASLAQAVVSSQQQAGDNSTLNEGRLDTLTDSFEYSGTQQLGDGLGYGTHSFGWGGYRGTEEGTYAGTSDQIGDVFPDVWIDGQRSSDPDTGRHLVHDQPNNAYWGHLDLDTETDARDTDGNPLPQSVTDPSGDGGVLAFSESGTYSGNERGRLRFDEYSDIELSGTFSGGGSYTYHIVTPSQNNAGMGDSVLMNAQGNIGVNIASGTNNLQNNSLAIAAVYPGANGGGENGGSEQP